MCVTAQRWEKMGTMFSYRLVQVCSSPYSLSPLDLHSCDLAKEIMPLISCRLISWLNFDVDFSRQYKRPRFDSWVRKIHWRMDRLPTPVSLGFPCGSSGKESACSVRDLGLILGFGRSPGEGKGYPLQYSSLENSESWTQLSDLHSHFHFSQVMMTKCYLFPGRLLVARKVVRIPPQKFPCFWKHIKTREDLEDSPEVEKEFSLTKATYFGAWALLSMPWRILILSHSKLKNWIGKP